MPEAPTFLVNVYNEPVLVKITGRACYLNCLPIKDFFRRLIEQGRRAFLVDFKGCSTMDSTFMGILAGLALELRRADPLGELRLVRLGERNLELVKNLGLHHILKIEQGEDGTIEGLPATHAPWEDSPETSPMDEKAQARMILQAHENLVEISDVNRSKFQDVLTYLREQVEDGDAARS